VKSRGAFGVGGSEDQSAVRTVFSWILNAAGILCKWNISEEDSLAEAEKFGTFICA
jgi:hypothetical protein